MSVIIEQFHFLRPEWLWALIPGVVLMVFLIRRGTAKGNDNWQRYIDEHLLVHLSLQGAKANASHRSWVAVCIALVIFITALAGPSWEKAETPSFHGGEPVVAVLSLAQSMNGNDVAPSRLKRAIHKLRDLLAQTQGTDRALVIYSDIPFIAAPLTKDAQVIEQMLPELSTNLMPVLGDRLDLAIAEAAQLLQRTHAKSGRIVVFTDSIGEYPEASIQAAEAARQHGYQVSVLGVGTTAGAMLQTADGQTINNRNGDALISKLPVAELQQLASKADGEMAVITAGGEDLARLLPVDLQAMAAGDVSDTQADSWIDNGFWLLLLPVLAAPLLFRRGLLFGLVLAVGVAGFQPEQAMAAESLETSSTVTDSLNQQSSDGGAFNWNGLWQTPDQQASEAFSSESFSTAAEAFESPDWQAASLYKAGDYPAAAREYASLNTSDKDYNLGNALAKAGDFQGALESYDNFLSINPDHENAVYNRNLIAKLLEQQQQQQQQQDQQQAQQSGSGSDEQQDQQSGSGSDEQQDQQSGSGSDEQQDQQSGSGSDEQQDQQSGSGSDEQQDQQSGSGSDEQQDQQSDSGTGEQQQKQHASNESAGESEALDTEQGLLSKLISEALQGNQDESEQSDSGADAASGSNSTQPLDQASEQQLRRVPDDPTGLLRARIRQHYAQLRAMQ